MTIPTGERSLHKVQMGEELTEGSPVNATYVFPAESASIIALDRAALTPEEDYGELAGSQPGRSSFGVRQATLPLRSVVRFEDLIRILQSALHGGVSPTNPSSGVYVWTFTADNADDTLVAKTIEEGDNKVVYRMPGALVQRLRLSFDALAPGAAAPWNLEATFLGRDKTVLPGGFSAATAPVGMETAMGHLTRLFYGPTATAFASLAELAKTLLACDLTIETGVTLRKQGGQGDTADSHGRGRVKVTFSILLEQIAGARTALWDVFESDAGNPVIPDRRMRIKIGGGDLDTDEIVTVALTGDPDGGDFTLTFGGDETPAIAFDAAAAQVQAALAVLPSIGPGNVQVEGDDGGPWTVRFINDLGDTDVGEITFDDTGLTGGTDPSLLVTVAQEGHAAVARSIVIDGRAEIDSLPVQEGAGSTRYSIQGRFVKDAILASVVQIAVTNGVSA